MRNAIGMTLLGVMVMAALAVPAQALDNPKANTVAYYRMEGSGTTFTDETGFHDGTGAAAVRTAGGAPGSGPFNAGYGGSSSANFNVGGSAPINPGNLHRTGLKWEDWAPQFTMEFALKWDGCSSCGLINGGIFGNDDGTGEYIKLSRNANGMLAIEVDPGVEPVWWLRYDLPAAAAALNISSGDWIDIAFINDNGKTAGAGSTSVFINGTEQNSHIDNDGGSAGGVLTGATWNPSGLPTDLWIGGLNQSGGQLSVNQLDEFRITSGIRDRTQLLSWPEPGTLTILALGGMMILRRRRA